MCVFLTVNFSECALSATVCIPACLSSRANPLGHICFSLFVRVFEGERRVFDIPSPLCFFDCARECVCVCVRCCCSCDDRLLLDLLTDSSIKSCCSGNPQ